MSETQPPKRGFLEWVMSWTPKTWAFAVGLAVVAILIFTAPDRVENALRWLALVVPLAG